MKRELLLFTLAILLLAGNSLRAQQTDANNGLKHWMTAEELLLKDQIGKGFVETDPPTGTIRNIEEFAPSYGVIIRYPFGIPITLIREMAEDDIVLTIVNSNSEKNTVINQYVAASVDTSNCEFLIAPSNSYWTRDYGPWYIQYADSLFGIVDFPYNRPRPADDEIPKKVAQMQGIEWFGMNVTHTGGNYMTTGIGHSSSTNLVWDENTDQSHSQIAQKLHDYCGIDDYMVVQDPNDTYIDHIDCWGKFIGPDKVMVRKVPASHPQYDEIEATAAYYASKISPYGTPYRVYRVNTPNNEPYSNSYILNKKVFLAFMGTAYDAQARIAYQQAMPGYEVIGFTGLQSAPWESTDALHCRTHEMADMNMLYIDHIPITGLKPWNPGYLINAKITAFSKKQIFADSTWVIYKVNHSGWDTLKMINTGGKNWQALIPAQMEGDTVSYYIEAHDASGRTANHPFIGRPDPHTFFIAHSPLAQLYVTPDTLLFTTDEEFYNGKSAYAINYSSQAITLVYCNDPGNHIPFWYLDPAIRIPVTVESGDSLELHVQLEPMPGKTDFTCDSLIIADAATTYKVMICTDPRLISASKKLTNSEEFSVFISPNPCYSNAVFDVKTSGEQIELQIFDLYGNTVYEVASEKCRSGNITFNWNCSARAPGIYFYRVMTGNETITGKIVKQ